MKLILVAFTALAVAAQAYELITQNYHEEIGIPMAARIKAAEDAADFDGSRITGGVATALTAFTHLGGLVITLRNGRTSVCGSSLLTNTRCVTAAHCWRHRTSRARNFVVVLGSNFLFRGGERIQTSKVEMHANYNDRTLLNNIAMITIPSVRFTNHINRINLPTGNDQYVGIWGIAAGFGRTSDTAQITNDQFKSHVVLEVISNAICQRTYGNTIQPSTLCVDTSDGRSICGGDAGGPLSLGVGINRVLIGVSSFGHSSGCTSGYPAGFARVTYFAPWLRQRM